MENSKLSVTIIDPDKKYCHICECNCSNTDEHSNGKKHKKMLDILSRSHISRIESTCMHDYVYLVSLEDRKVFKLTKSIQ